ncbi:DUF1254 domain-containing protein [Zeimonas arvi]|uniref:DUF1254 domain-containing protein n=1 Tax=Zeimonas arvi TaxID=2498847 RepID=A0A5C8NVS5_9BURK|nr:DUF1254 domain-containing protein [Zeimonas arvi]TXL65311.1 DUF1254 domain-containing protein [Zeimonas arvi]
MSHSTLSQASTSLEGLARRAVLYSLPLYEMARMRAATCPRRGPAGEFAASDRDSTVRWCNGFTHSRALLTPANREVVSPNNDTLYDNAWLDLGDGPLVIEVPDMGDRYWTLGLLDFWTNPFAYAGRRTTGNRAQRLFVHGPRWRGTVPEGMIRIGAPGDDAWLIGRMLVDPNDDDLAAAHRLQDAYAIRRASDGAPAWKRTDSGFDGRRIEVPEPEAYLRVVAEALARTPAPASEAGLLASFAAFGLVDGRPTEDRQAREAFTRVLPQVYHALREDVQGTQLGGGWHVPITIRTGYGDDYPTRARVARNLIGALGIEEAMYPVCEVDAQGRALSGSARYEIHFAPGLSPQVDAFWSLTMYRRRDCLLVENPIDRHSIGDRTPGLVREPDGSLRIRLQAVDPGVGSNWLPSPADDDFYLILRLYQPREAHLQMQFTYPPLRRLD